MRDTTSNELDEKDSQLVKLKEERDVKETALKESTKSLEKSRKYCWFGTQLCDIGSKEEEVAKKLSDSSVASLRVETLEFQFGAKSQMKDQVDIVLAKLTDEREELERQLAESKPSSSSSLVEDVGTTEPFQPQEIQDNWAMFDFSSTKSSKESSSHSVETSTTASFGTWYPAALGSASTSFGIKASLNMSKVQVLKSKLSYSK